MRVRYKIKFNFLSIKAVTVCFFLFVMTAGFAVTYTWMGAVDTDWDNAGNWSPTGVPSMNDVAVINSGGNQPVIENQTVHISPTTKSVTVDNLIIDDNAELTIVSKKNDVKLKCISGIINKGKITLDLRRYSKKIEFTKTEFLGNSEIYIDAPFSGSIAYDVAFFSDSQINFKENSVITAENGYDSDILSIQTPILSIKGSFTCERKLSIQPFNINLIIDISGTLTAKRDVIISDSGNTVITSSGTVNLEKNLNLSTAKWNATGGSVTTKGDLEVPNFKQTSGDLKLMSGAMQNIKVNQVYNITVNKTVFLQGPLIILGILENKGYFDSNGHDVNFTGTDSRIKGAPSTTRTGFTNLKISASAKLTLENDINIAGTFTNDGTFKAGGNTVIFEGSSSITGSNVIEFANIKIEPSGTLTLIKPITVVGTLTNDGTFNANGKTVTFKGANSKIRGSQVTAFSDLKIDSSKKLTLEKDIKILAAIHNDGEFDPGTHKVTFTGPACEVRGDSNSTFYNFEVEIGANCEIHRDIIIKKSLNIKNMGVFNAAYTQRTVYLEPSGSDVTITGTNSQNSTKFYSIKCENAGGKTLKIVGKISVEKEMILSGTLAQKLIASGTNGKIYLKASNTGTGNYLDIDTVAVSIQPDTAGISGWEYEVYNSQKNGTPVSPLPAIYNGWKFMGGNPPPSSPNTFYWIGKNDTKWETLGNWAQISGSVYVVSTDIPNYNSEVIIPAKEEIIISGVKYPVHYPKLELTFLTGEFRAKSVEIKKGSTEDKNGELDLSQYVITAGFSKNAKIENYGTLKLAGTAAQKTWFKALADRKINLKPDCIVEYNDIPAVSSDVWEGPYQNLKISGSRRNLKASSIGVLKHLTVKVSPVKITAESGNQTYSGNIIAFEGTSNYDLTLESTGTIQTPHTVTAGNITVNGNWTSDKVDARGNISVNNSSPGKTWTASGDIIVKGNLTAAKLTQTGGSLTFKDTGVNVSELNLTDDSSKVKELNIKSSAKVRLGSLVKIENTFLNEGTFYHNHNRIIFTGNASIGKSGTPGIKTEFYDIETAASSSLSLYQDIDIKHDFNSSGTTLNANGKTVTFVKGTSSPSLSSAISGSNASFAHLTIENGKTLTLNGNIGITGTLKNDGVLTAGGKTVTFNNTSTISGAAVTQFANLTIAGGTLLLAKPIKVSGTFNYSAGTFNPNSQAVTFNGTGSQITGTAEVPFADLNIENGKKLTAGCNIKINNSTFNNQGTFAAGSKTVTFSGNCTVKGQDGDNATEFYQLETDPPNSKLTLMNDIKVNKKIKCDELDGKTHKKTVFCTGNSTEIGGTPPTGNITFYNLEIKQGNCKPYTDIIITNSFTNKGSFNANLKTVNFAPEPNSAPANTVTVTGTGTSNDTRFYTFSLQNGGGKTLRIGGKINVEFDFLLSGSAKNNLLTVERALAGAEINLLYDRTGGKWLKVKTNIPIADGHTYTVAESEAEEADGLLISEGNPKNWIFDKYLKTLVWTGNTSTDWNTRTNWAPAGDPATSELGVRIPPGRPRYPILTADSNVITADIDGGTLDLSAYRLNTVPPAAQMGLKLRNGGTLKLHGTALQIPDIQTDTDIASAASSPAGTSTVIYYNAVPADVTLAAAVYHNLQVHNKTKFQASSLTTEGETVIKNTAAIEAQTQHYKDVVKVEGADCKFQTAAAAPFGGSLTFEKKLTASGVNIELNGGSISSKKEIEAAGLTAAGRNWTAEGNINLTADFNSSVENMETKAAVNAVAVTVSGKKWKAKDVTASTKSPTDLGKITVKSEQLETYGAISADDEIKAEAPFTLWKSSGNITAKKSITIPGTSDWKASAGHIKCAVNFTAEKFVQTGGKLELNGSAAQTLKADILNELTVNNSGTANADLHFNKAGTLEARQGKAVLKKDIIITKAFTNSGGEFDALTGKKTVNLEPENTLKITGKNVPVSNDAQKNQNTGTRFYKLHCIGQGGKVLEFYNDIEILRDISGDPGFVPVPDPYDPSIQFTQDESTLKLEGTSSNRLTIGGNGNIWFNSTPPYPRPKKGGKYLYLSSGNISIRGGCYRVMDSDHLPGLGPRNWIFEEYATIISSLVITNKNKVLVKFAVPVNKPLKTTLTVRIPGMPVFRSKDVHHYPAGSTSAQSDKWVFEFDETFIPEFILEKNTTLSMGQDVLDPIFIAPGSNLRPEKFGWISDIGLNLVNPLFAANTKIIRVWDGTGRLPFLNTKIAVQVPLDKPLTMRLDRSLSNNYWVHSKPALWKTPHIANDTYNPLSALFNIEPHLSTPAQKIFALPTTHPKIMQESHFEFMLYYDDLPCARLKDENDFFSFDLWRFNLMKSVLQRGGVSILSNVIDPRKGQKTTIEITTQKEGMLTVQIMTLDGNILKTIERSHKPAGNYSYYWDGRNNSGSIAARGIYFVRVSGAGIDEIRKIMLVRE